MSADEIDGTDGKRPNTRYINLANYPLVYARIKNNAVRFRTTPSHIIAALTTLAIRKLEEMPVTQFIEFFGLGAKTINAERNARALTELRNDPAFQKQQAKSIAKRRAEMAKAITIVRKRDRKLLGR